MRGVARAPLRRGLLAGFQTAPGVTAQDGLIRGGLLSRFLLTVEHSYTAAAHTV
jgi:hypothetical protein